jgi:hypothetical protein
LGGLGAAEGAPVYVSWTPPSQIPSLLPWFGIAALLLLPGNRQAKAWWLLAPLLFVTVATEVVLRLGPSAGEFQEFLQLTVPASFGLGACWALAHLSIGKPRAAIGFGFLVTAEFFAVAALMLRDAPYGNAVSLLQKTVLTALAVFVIWIALGATGLLLKRTYRPVFLVRSFFGIVTLIVAIFFGSMVGLAALMGSQAPPLGSFLLAVLAVVAVLVGIVFPFIFLSFSNSVYRERLKGLLKLDPEVAPGAPALGSESALISRTS